MVEGGVCVGGLAVSSGGGPWCFGTAVQLCRFDGLCGLVQDGSDAIEQFLAGEGFLDDGGGPGWAAGTVAPGIVGHHIDGRRSRSVASHALTTSDNGA